MDFAPPGDVIKSRDILPTSDRLHHQDNADSYIAKIKKTLQHENLDFTANASILFLLPEKHSDLYAGIKIAGDQLGIPTVCCVAEKLKSRSNKYTGANEPQAQTLSNLCMKFNLKLGGDNYWLGDDSFSAIKATDTPLDTIVMGADVGHPDSVFHRRVSFHGCSCWQSRRQVHELPGIHASATQPTRGKLAQKNSSWYTNSLQVISNMAEMVKERLLAWCHTQEREGSASEKLPSSILFYRDGVSESQYGDVHSVEIKRIKRGFQLALDETTQRKPGK